MSRTLILTFAGLLLPISASAATKSVRVDFVEALSPKDTTSSLRFQEEFEQAISTAKARLQQKLQKCGYSLQTETSFFDANDPLQAKEKAERSAASGSWVIVGPRRSNHYLLLAKGSGEVPTVSLMASASEVSDLGPTHVSISPSNGQMAKVAADESRKLKGKGASYLTIVSEDCVSCVDFADLYHAAAKNLGLKDLGTVKIRGESPDLTEALEKVAATKPQIIVVPNYSKVAAQVISKAAKSSSNPIFVGSDGWGDSNFGFLQNDSSVQSAKGFTVRGFPPVAKSMQLFSLGKAVAASTDKQPTGGPGVAILKSLDAIGEMLCEAKPKTRSEFAARFAKTSKKKLSAPFGVSVYKLSASNIVYEKQAAVK